MKKTGMVLLAAALLLALAACGKKPADSTQANQTSTALKTTQTSSAAKTESQQSTSADNEVRDVFYPHTLYGSAYVTIEINESIEMDDATAWLGFCPEGIDYIYEREADDADIVFWYPEAYEKGLRAAFACDFENVPDGKYAMVVCTSDDEAVGYVVIQMNVEKKGDVLTFDYDSAQLKSRPSQKQDK